MKKTLTYVTTAILLGMVVMLFPVLILYLSQPSPLRRLTPAPTTESTPLPSLAPEALEDTQKSGGIDAEAVAVTPFPLSLTYVGLIFILGFVVAFGVSQYYKRKTAPPMSPL